MFDHPVIGRCQLHERHNVQDHLPERLRSLVGQRMRLASHAASAMEDQALLESLGAELDKTHPGVAASMREVLVDTLTVLRLGAPPRPGHCARPTRSG